MPPKKKTPRNAFYYFMEDFREHEETKGRFYNSIAEVAKSAGDVWQEMSPEERQPYEDKKNEMKKKQKSKKYNALGEDVCIAKKREEEEEYEKRCMEKTIQEIVSDGNDFVTKNFYVAHVNHYCFCTALNQHIPAEISIVRFNLQDGIDLEDCYSVILDIGEMPMGYRLTALTVSEETHNIPIPPHEGEIAQISEKNIRKAFFSMVDFLRKNVGPRDYLPPVYVDTNNMNIAKDVFKNLHFDHDPNNVFNKFSVYSLSYLFYVLRNAAHSRATGEKAFPFHSIAQNELERDVYDFVKGIACTYHDTNDCAFQHCTLSQAIRKIFIICDHTCSDLNIQLIPGRHVPMNSRSTRLESRPCSQNDWVSVSRNNNRPASAVSNGPSKPAPVNNEPKKNVLPNPPPSRPESVLDDTEGAAALPPPPVWVQETLPKGIRKPQSRSIAQNFKPQQPPDLSDFPALGAAPTRPRNQPIGRGRGRMLQQ